MRRVLLPLVLAALAGHAHAASVFKCVDAAGKVTFTQQSCPDSHALDDVVSARNDKPSGSGAASRMAPPAPPPTPRSGGQRYTVVGEKPAVQAPIATTEAMPTTSDGVRRSVSRQPQIRYEERLVDCSYTNKKGNRVGCSRMIKVPVAR